MAGETDDDRAATMLERPSRPGMVFAPGDILSQRYYIVKFLAEGGMGEVYEARDTVLAERVALKTIRGEAAKKPHARARFMREIHVARQVTHPNVCRVFDVGEHNGTMFLTMQLLEGESLAALLKRQKQLAPDVALGIARQIAAAIDASHAAGVIHRDLKPANIVLVPASGSGEPRVVVTDFGLARAGGDDEHHVSNTGDVGGTPAYMAPEQVEGTKVGPPADIYAFGVVLFEVVTGKRPFVGESTISAAVKRLKEDAPSPRSVAPELDDRWDRAILRCLERVPERRFANARNVIAAIDGNAAIGGATRDKSSPTTVPTRRAAPRRWIAAAAALAVVAGTIAIVLATRGDSGASHAHTGGPAAATSGRRSLAVIGFKNLSGRQDTAWISTAAAELLAADLGAGGAIRTLSGEDVARARAELSLPDADAFNANTLARIRGDLGADLVVVGSYLVFGDHAEKLRLDVRVQDAARGETINTTIEQGVASDLPALAEKTGAKLRDQLGLARVSPEVAGQVRASFPANADAARLYAEGLAKSRAYDSLGAQSSLEQAIAIAPDDPMIHAALSEVWTDLGYEGRAREQAKLALDHAGAVSPQEHELIEARYHRAANEWTAAADAIRKASDAAPDDVELKLRLAGALIAADRTQDALDTLDAVRKLPGAGDDPRIDYLASLAYVARTEYQLGRDAARRAGDRAHAIGAIYIEADARFEQAWAAYQFGDSADATQAGDDASRIFTAAHNAMRLGGLDSLRAQELMSSGQHLDEAEQVAQRAYSTFRAAGAVAQLESTAITLGEIATYRNDQRTAERYFREGLELARSTDDSGGAVTALEDVADAERLQGRLSDAARDDADALRSAASDETKAGLIQTLSQIALAAGDNVAALQRAKEAVGLSSRAGVWVRCLAEEQLGRAQFESGDIAGARKSYEAGFTELSKADMRGVAAQCEADLAELDLAEHRPAAAVERCEHAMPALGQDAGLLGRALAIQLSAELDAGKLPAARATAVRLDGMSKQLDPDTRVYAEVATANQRAASGDVVGARKLLAVARAEADQLGLGLGQLEIELATGQIELRHGNAASARTRLAKLADNARAKGFVRIADVATAAAK